MPRGGKRSGAGRNPGQAKVIERKTALRQAAPEIKIVRASAGGKAVTAALILASVDEGALWQEILTATTVKAVRVSGGEKDEREIHDVGC